MSDFDKASSIIEIVTSLQLAVAERAHHAPVVPCELPDGIRLVYADDHGRQHTVDLHDANLVDFGLANWQHAAAYTAYTRHLVEQGTAAWGYAQLPPRL